MVPCLAQRKLPGLTFHNQRRYQRDAAYADQGVNDTLRERAGGDRHEVAQNSESYASRGHQHYTWRPGESRCEQHN